MIDSRTAAHVALYTTLNATTALTDLADVWGHPEEGTEPTANKSLVLIGPASCENIGGKDGGLDQVTISIFAEVRKPDITELYAVSSLIRSAIEGQTVSAPGALLSKPEFLDADPELMEDGETFFDTLRFRLLVQPA
jgi:hypothetical protein